MPSIIESAKPYTEYLDKEMTIMGILSAFSVAAAVGPVNAVFSSDKETIYRELSQYVPSFVVLGAGLQMLAAFFFYRERSLLAYYYGQICLSGVAGDTGDIAKRR